MASALKTAQGSQFAILVGGFLLMFGPMLVRRFLRPMPNFGRYLFPFLGSIGLLVVWGLSAWLPRRWHGWLVIGLTLGMLALGASGLACYLAPAFRRPPAFDDGEAPMPTYQVDRTYAIDGKLLARLVGYDLDRPSVKPGESLEVALTWEVVEETEENYVLFAQLFGREGEKLGQRDTYPGLGHYPTSLWEAGETIVDEVPIPVAGGAAAPSRLRLDVGLYQPGAGRLAAFDRDGRKIPHASIGWLTLSPTADPPPPASSADYALGSMARLVGYDLEQTSDRLHLALHWSSQAPTDEDYVVFVHMLDQDGKLVTQTDGPPVGGDYPTSFWSTGERVVDRRLLSLEDVEPGTYVVKIGMYDLDTGDRLPIQDGAGNRVPDDAIPLAEVVLQ